MHWALKPAMWPFDRLGAHLLQLWARPRRHSFRLPRAGQL